MSAGFYHLSHFAGVLVLLLGVGGMIACSGPDGGRAPKLITILYWLGLLAVPVAGFGRAAKLGLGFPAWMWLKVLCWLAIGLIPQLIRRTGMPRFFAVVLAVGAGIAAFWLAQHQPSF